MERTLHSYVDFSLKYYLFESSQFFSNLLLYQSPDSIPSIQRVAETYIQGGEYQIGFTFLTHTKTTWTKNSKKTNHIYFLFGSLCYFLEKYRLGIRILKPLLKDGQHHKHTPTSVIHFRIGQIYQRLGDLEKSKKYFSSAVQYCVDGKLFPAYMSYCDSNGTLPITSLGRVKEPEDNFEWKDMVPTQTNKRKKEKEVSDERKMDLSTNRDETSFGGKLSERQKVLEMEGKTSTLDDEEDIALINRRKTANQPTQNKDRKMPPPPPRMRRRPENLEDSTPSPVHLETPIFQERIHRRQKRFKSFRIFEQNLKQQAMGGVVNLGENEIGDEQDADSDIHPSIEKEMTPPPPPPPHHHHHQEERMNGYQEPEKKEANFTSPIKTRKRISIKPDHSQKMDDEDLFLSPEKQDGEDPSQIHLPFLSPIRLAKAVPESTPVVVTPERTLNGSMISRRRRELLSDQPTPRKLDLRTPGTPKRSGNNDYDDDDGDGKKRRRKGKPIIHPLPFQSSSVLLELSIEEKRKIEEVFIILGDAYLSLRRFNLRDAIMLYRSLPSELYQSGYVQSKLGLCFYHLELYSKAVEYFKKVMFWETWNVKNRDIMYYSSTLWHLKDRRNLLYLANSLKASINLSQGESDFSKKLGGNERNGTTGGSSSEGGERSRGSYGESNRSSKNKNNKNEVVVSPTEILMEPRNSPGSMINYYVCLANCSSVQGDHVGAVRHLRKILRRIGNSYSEIWYPFILLGHELLELDQFGKARTSFRAALRRTGGKSHLGWAGLGSVALRVCNNHTACEYFLRSLKLRKNSSVCLTYLGIAQYRLGNYESSVYAFRKACFENPLNAFCKLKLAVCLARMGKFKEALEVLNSLTSEFHDEPHLAKAYGDIYVGMGKKAKALEYYQKAVQLKHVLSDDINMRMDNWGGL